MSFLRRFFFLLYLGFLDKFKPWIVKSADVQHLYLGRHPPVFTEMRVLQESSDDDHLVLELGVNFLTADDMSAVLAAKLQDLSGLCEDLQNADSRRSMEFDRMKNRITFLESDREGLKSKLAEYVLVIASLKDNIASLEQTPTLQTKRCIFLDYQKKN